MCNIIPITHTIVYIQYNGVLQLKFSLYNNISTVYDLNLIEKHFTIELCT